MTATAEFERIESNESNQTSPISGDAFENVKANYRPQ
jgi:hypothetical protein